MGRKSKVSKEIKIQCCLDYLNGKESLSNLIIKYKVGETSIKRWIKKYRVFGDVVFDERATNNHYTKEFKDHVVMEYLSRKYSYSDMMIKYNIPSRETIRIWVMKYNEGEENKDYNPKPEVYNMAARKTTIDERKEIVQYCIEHENDYREPQSCMAARIPKYING